MLALGGLLEHILRLHESIRDAVVNACEQRSSEQISQVSRDLEGDTVYAIDTVGEEIMLEYLEKNVAPQTGLILISEGLPEDRIVLPRGASEEDALWRMIVDPIDGTRGLMYQKRSAWVLTGVAPNRGQDTGLHHIELAVQTEIPLVKQHLSDVLWCFAGENAQAERFNRLTGARHSMRIGPSRARTIEHGFATISRFFPGVREELAALDEQIVFEALGPVKPGKAHCFEDQYISTGGQLYELMVGHDRFIADLRPVMEEVLSKRGLSLGICCHPYDLCTELIARQAGVIITDPDGQPLKAPLAVEPNIAWVGYANRHIRAQIEPLLQRALSKYVRPSSSEM